jgi:hypothetical protein
VGLAPGGFFFTIGGMSAKHAKKSGNKPTPPAAPQPAMAAASASATSAAAPAAAPGEATRPFVPWIDSDDPRKKMIGKIVLVAAWIYVAALWLLALDQTFHWGIFGPKVPPVP